MAKPRAAKPRRKGRAEDTAKAPARISVAPKPASVAPPPDPPSAPEPAEAAEPPPRRSARPPPPPASAPARWEERDDKDAYAFELLERLVRYYGGRASAGAPVGSAMRSAAIVLSTLSLGLATSDDEQLAALALAARELRKGGRA